MKALRFIWSCWLFMCVALFLMIIFVGAGTYLDIKSAFINKEIAMALSFMSGSAIAEIAKLVGFAEYRARYGVQPAKADAE